MHTHLSPIITDQIQPAHAHTALGFGLSASEYHHVCALLQTKPSVLECAIFGAMWSEHCCYKSTRVHLRRLPSNGPCVVCGPGGNAGVITTRPNQERDPHTPLVAFKVESHNHPSFIEPYQGAATGVGGILRDIIAMGAHPVALLNLIATGMPHLEVNQQKLRGIVAGIAGYGNAIGIPTVGGAVLFDEHYHGNVLVNAMAVGLIDATSVLNANAHGINNRVVYLGQATGRDGIHGAAMSSSAFAHDTAAKKPTIQVGDPYTGRRLMQAVSLLAQEKLIVAIQDMGAAGLTSSSFEMAHSGDVGMEIALDRVPSRVKNITPLELMLSETQERMLLVVKPQDISRVSAIATQLDLACADIGHVCPQNHIVLRWHTHTISTIATRHIIDDAPLYTHPMAPSPESSIALSTNTSSQPSASIMKLSHNPWDVLHEVMKSPDLASRRWVYQQYDGLVGQHASLGAGLDAGIVGLDLHSSHDDHNATPASTQYPEQSHPTVLPRGSELGSLALCLDANPHWVAFDPLRGSALTVCEVYRNLCAMGAQPLALTDCLNFGNPLRPHVMRQIHDAIDGIAQAAQALKCPVVSGNVSLNNATEHSNGHIQDILPTPSVGGVGWVPTPINIKPANDGDTLWLIGSVASHLAATAAQRIFPTMIRLDKTDTLPPPNYQQERDHGLFIQQGLREEWIGLAHDISEGGLLVAITELLLWCNKGAVLDHMIETQGTSIAALFGEDPARYVVTTSTPEDLLEKAKAMNIALHALGHVHGKDMLWGDAKNPAHTLSLQALRDDHEAFLPKHMA